MVERYLFAKLEPVHATAVGRREVAAAARAAFREIPGVSAVVIGTPVDEAAARSWDISIVIRFAGTQELGRFSDHAAQQGFVRDFLGARAEIIKHWNFDVEGNP